MKDEHQPAFPTQILNQTFVGMTLRDYFAAQAMINTDFFYETGKKPLIVDQSQATWCYDIADAMMKARKNVAIAGESHE